MKIHYLSERLDSGMYVSACGWIGGERRHFSTQADDVECKACLRRMAGEAAEPAFVPHVVEDYEPGTHYDKRYDAIAYADVPGRPSYRCRWPSVDRALRDLVVIRSDGFVSKSAASVTDRIGRQGVRVQGGSRRVPRAMRQAEDAAAVERSLSWAIRQSARELSPDAQRAIVLARQVGELIDAEGKLPSTLSRHAVDRYKPVPASEIASALSIDEVEVGVVVREVLHWLRVDMAARGLVPPPTGARTHAWMERRREELRLRRAS
ncbi:MAG: hypothetical protein AAGE52_01165 [Myxococcota bacterium]